MSYAAHHETGECELFQHQSGWNPKKQPGLQLDMGFLFGFYYSTLAVISPAAPGAHISKLCKYVEIKNKVNRSRIEVISYASHTYGLEYAN